MTTRNMETEKSPRETVHKVQCADCWAWVKRDESHTCEQQVRHNQKGQRRGR
jgi:hypothetical protein